MCVKGVPSLRDSVCEKTQLVWKATRRHTWLKQVHGPEVQEPDTRGLSCCCTHVTTGQNRVTSAKPTSPNPNVVTNLRYIGPVPPRRQIVNPSVRNLRVNTSEVICTPEPLPFPPPAPPLPPEDLA